MRLLLLLACLAGGADAYASMLPRLRSFGISAPAAAKRSSVPTATLAKSTTATLAKSDADPLVSALPVFSYAGLAGVTFVGIKLIEPVLAWQGVMLVGGCVALPALLLVGQLLFAGGNGLAEQMGGKPAGPRVTRLANEAAAAVGVAPPAHVFEIEANEANAFAAGIRDKDRTVAVTSGLLNQLSENEVKAVLAHEMGHLRNADVSRSMHVAIAAAGLGGMYTAGRMILRSSGSRSRSSSSKEDKSDNSAALGLTLMAAGLGSQAVAHGLRLAASRGQELKADRAAAEAFGAETIASALTKIDRAAKQQRSLGRSGALRDSVIGASLSHAMISNPDDQAPSAAAKSKTSSWWDRATSAVGNALRTHPTLEQRLDALRSYDGEQRRA